MARARGVHKRYGGRTVLVSLDLDIPAGCAFGLVGPNGAGKTTFIKILLGIVRPSGGSVELMGLPPQDPKARRAVGYLPERLTLPDAWTPVDHLRAVLRLKGSREAPEPLLERVGLERGAFRRRMGGFSKGMKQRVGLACALAGSPALLVLDEPTDGIDPIGRMEIRELLAERVRDGATVFLNSHLLAETERLCDRVAILGGGELLAAGDLASLSRQSAPTAKFEPHPDLELIAARHGLQAMGAGYVHPEDGSEPMSRALAGALADGLVLTELGRSSTDLEAVLRGAVEGER